MKMTSTTLFARGHMIIKKNGDAVKMKYCLGAGIRIFRHFVTLVATKLFWCYFYALSALVWVSHV